MSDRTIRAQSGPLGLLLVFAMMIVSTTVVVGLGVGVIGDSQQQLQGSSAESAMTQVDSKAAMVAIGSSDTQQVDLPSGSASGYQIDDSAGHITVESSLHGTVLDADLGAMTYEDGRSTVAYQGGGVWRESEGGGTVMVSPPEFHYRDSTLTLPIITLSGDEQVTGRASISRNNVDTKFPSASMGWQNPVGSGDVTVTIQSQYYEAWAHYFETRTEGNVITYDGSNEAVLELQVPSNNPSVSAGVISGAASSTLDLKNSATVDSYDSTSGDYGSSSTDNGKVTTAGDIQLKNDASIEGDVEIGGTLTMKKDSRINGDLEHSGSTNYHDTESTHVTGSASATANVVGPSAVNSLIDQKVDNNDDSSENDNGAHSTTINALENGNCASTTCELTAGQYYVSNVDLTDGTGTDLELDTGGGEITLVVDGDFDLASSSSIEVTGSNRVNVYTTGNVELGNSAKIFNAGDDAPQFWVYMYPTATGDLKQDAEFTGVMYGPGSTGAGASITVRNSAEVFGALVGDVGDLKNSQEIHYDSALQSTTTIPAPSVPTVRYLHVSEHETKIEG